jgi:hypothetical protein
VLPGAADHGLGVADDDRRPETAVVDSAPQLTQKRLAKPVLRRTMIAVAYPGCLV